MILSIQSYQKMKIKSMIYQRIPEPQIYFKTNEKAAFEAKSGIQTMSVELLLLSALLAFLRSSPVSVETELELSGMSRICKF